MVMVMIPTQVVDDDLIREVSQAVEERRGELLDLCRALVETPSANPPGDTTGVAAILGAYLAGQGIASRTAGRSAIKPNLVAEIAGRGPGRHLIFNVHLDTLQPGNESDWTVPIHRMTRRDGRLHGLGIGNMKGAVAAQALATALLARRFGDWSGRISFTAVADETVFGPDGAAFLLEDDRGLIGDAVICGEGPGRLGLALAEKGVCWLEIEARAPSRQGMLARRGESAIVRLAAVIGELDALNELRVDPPAEIASVARDGDDGLRLSVNPGTIAGGYFVSQMAPKASVAVDFRIPPGLTVEAVEARVAAIVARYPDMSFSRIKAWDPNWTGMATPVAQALAQAHGRIRGETARTVVRLPASDASRWRALGVPAICYGPQADTVSGVDDHVLEQDLLDCAKIYTLAALSFLRRSS